MRYIKTGTSSVRYSLLAAAASALAACATAAPSVLQNGSAAQSHYLPDFSYAGYAHGEREPALKGAKVFDVTDFGAKPNDDTDDSNAIGKAVAAAHQAEGPVVVRFPAGRFIVTEFIYIERSDFVLQGAGSGATTLYFPRPLSALQDPPALEELREYLVTLNKRQRNKALNLDLPYSQYSWSGGFIWTRVPGERVKPYLDKYNQPQKVIAQASGGQRGGSQLQVSVDHGLEVGDVVRINWYNRAGEKGPLLKSIYQNTDVKIGSHHWTRPELPLVSQQVEIAAVDGTRVTIKDTLLHDIGPDGAEIAKWPHLKNVGIEYLRLEFPSSPPVDHHVEHGFNGIYLTRLFHSWVRDLEIHNADSGILTEEIANVTIKNITTTGDTLAHYTVAMGDTHNVLVKNLQVHNRAYHSLSLNTFSTRTIYTQSQVFQNPVLDQHSGANHQNLFDNIHVHVHLTPEQLEERRYPLFKGGGAGYWKPSHGAFNTHWNIFVQADKGFASDQPLTLWGVNDGPHARLIGIHGNLPLALDYGPDAYVEDLNELDTEVPSLYEYQLRQRLQR